MPTEPEVPEIVAEVRQRLADAANQGIHLQVTRDKLEDDWLYVVVTPFKPGESASDHALLMSRIERDLKKQGKDHVLLIPVLED
jgi:hypothetical protein